MLLCRFGPGLRRTRAPRSRVGDAGAAAAGPAHPLVEALGQAPRPARGRRWSPAGIWVATGGRDDGQNRRRVGLDRSHRGQLGHAPRGPPPGNLGFDRGSRAQRGGRADGRWSRTRPSRGAVRARSRRASVADLHIRTGRRDPDTPLQGASPQRTAQTPETPAHRPYRVVGIDRSPTCGRARG